ncbi:hypothetical protein C1646_773117 [Rhizophagus diaphanus]|nr:hypothetical protein C1646_773117 [Rhizophagus diaphanus] [Rhizophagus sp. MUCL 43196]
MKTAILNINFPYDSLRNNSDILFNFYYNSSYSGSDLLSNVYHNSLYDSSNLLISDLYDDSSNLFFESHKVYNETQIGNLEECDENVNYQEEYDSSEYEIDEENHLKLSQEMEFKIWKLAESYFNKYVKHQGFCFQKKRHIQDPNDNTITRRRTYECS